MENQTINMGDIKEQGKAELLEILDSLRGRKSLIIDAPVIGLLNRIIPDGIKSLKDNGVISYRELKGEKLDYSPNLSVSSSDTSQTPDHILYFTRPSLPDMKIIAKQISNAIKTGIRTQFHLYFIPHRTVVCEQLLEQFNILKHINIGEYGIGFIPVDRDILSLDMDGVFKQCYVDGDTSSLNIVAHALFKLQTTVGIIPVIKSKGAASRKVVQKVFRLRKEENASKLPLSTPSSSCIDTLVILDREVDLVSPLVTPLTYEGLVDELIGINNGSIRVDQSLLPEEEPLKMPSIPGQPDAPPPPAPVRRIPGEKIVIPLDSSSDFIYDQIQDLSIEKLGSFLQEKAISIRQTYSSFRENKEASLTEIHGFVKRMPALSREYKALTQHINIAQYLKQSTDSKEFRELWQTERGLIEGELLLDIIEDMVCMDIHK